MKRQHAETSVADADYYKLLPSSVPSLAKRRALNAHHAFPPEILYRGVASFPSRDFGLRGPMTSITPSFAIREDDYTHGLYYAQPSNAPRIYASYFSTRHHGTFFGGSCEACCVQLKLADRLYLFLNSQGRSHMGELHISFTTKPRAAVVAAPAARVASASSFAPGGKVAGAGAGAHAGTSSHLRTGAGRWPLQGGGTYAQEPDDEVSDDEVSEEGQYVEAGLGGGAAGAGAPVGSAAGSTITSACAGVPCTYAQWRRSWGPDVVTRPTTVPANKGAVRLEGCGVTVQLSTHGRTNSASVLVLQTPMPLPCSCCKTVALDGLFA